MLSFQIIDFLIISDFGLISEGFAGFELRMRK